MNEYLCALLFKSLQRMNHTTGYVRLNNDALSCTYALYGTGTGTILASTLVHALLQT